MSASKQPVGGEGTSGEQPESQITAQRQGAASKLIDDDAHLSAQLVKLKERIGQVQKKRQACTYGLNDLRLNIKQLRKDTDMLLKEQTRSMAIRSKRF